MHSKQSQEKAHKIDSKSKKLFKTRKTSAKKRSANRSPTPLKKQQPKSCLSFYLSDQCSHTLNAFSNASLYPKPLQLNYQDPNQICSAMTTLKTQDTLEPFEDQIDKMRFLTNSQEGLIERFLQDKYSCSKSSANLQEIYCYTTAKNLLQTQFQEFFLKRNEFLKQMQPNLQENYEVQNQEIKIEMKEPYNEYSFSTTNVSSPSINSPYILGFANSNYGYQENFYNSMMINAKGCPEMMLNMLNENENIAANKYFLKNDEI